MIICEIKHEGNGRRFVFASRCRLNKGVEVMCDTCYGNRHGVVEDCFEVDTESYIYKKYLEAMGAREPLKEIIGIYVPFEWIEKKRK